MFKRSTILGVVVILGCGGADEQPAAEAEPPRGPVILEPTDGAVLSGPSVTVRLGTRDVEIVPAGTNQPNSGHHHLYLDRDLSAADAPIPPTDGFIIHLGAAQTEFVFDSVGPGEHVLIARIGDWVHVPLADAATDTVRFTIR